MASFNLALLTKQAWRITTQPKLLISRILKVRYFLGASFSCSELGDRPSLTWRSILLARQCLEAGLGKRIGNGLKTSIWGDAWLLSEGTGRIITTRLPSSSFPNTVSDFIDWEHGSWAVDQIEQSLCCDDARVLQVHIGTPSSEDYSYWAFSKNGRFMVRSAYHFILSQVSTEPISYSGSLTNDWKGIWGLSIPPKIRLFLWRACSDCLPVRAALVK